MKHVILLAVVLLAGSTTVVFAQVPGPADAGRVRQEDKLPPDQPRLKPNAAPSAPPPSDIPDGAKRVRFVLKSVRIEGMTVFPQSDFVDLYKPYLGKTVSLELAWQVANAITQRYRDQGFFLSRAYVPAQKGRKGLILIKVVEGYIGKIDLPPEYSDNIVLQAFRQRLLSKKPIKSDYLESILLRLNDYPGLSFRSVLSQIEEERAPEGAVQLSLVPEAKPSERNISFDNFGSRFLGPYEMQAGYTTSFRPGHLTTLSAMMSLPTNEMQYGTISHSIAVAPNYTLQFSAGRTLAYPGYTLSPLEMESVSTSLSTRLSYQWIRQRQKNLNVFVSFDTRDTDGDILGGLPLSRDRLRVLRAGLTYDVVDDWNGSNILSFTLSKGLRIMGASGEGDPNLSRAEAIPDFVKVDAQASRLQVLNEEWSVLGALSAQWSSAPLLSSEEFGYGGQSFGRAYDSSEITGDSGLNASLEVRYGGVPEWQSFTFSPYAFFDAGIVWNRDTTQEQQSTGASTGLGMRVNVVNGLLGNVGLAWPLGRQPSTPINGEAGNPRIFLNISHQF